MARSSPALQRPHRAVALAPEGIVGTVVRHKAWQHLEPSEAVKCASEQVWLRVYDLSHNPVGAMLHRRQDQTSISRTL